MRQRLFIPLVFLASFLLSNHSIAQESKIDTSPLENKQGYLVVKITFNNPFVKTTSDSGISRMKLNGVTTHNFKDIYLGNNFYIVKLPEGDYYWDKMFIAPREYYTLSDSEYKVKVIANKISYSGDLIVFNKGGGKAKFEYINRSISIYKFLEKHHSDFLKSFPIIFTGYGRDHLFNYLEQKVEKVTE